jgi:hypothetical protein
MSMDEQRHYSQFGDLSISRVFHGKLLVVYNLLNGSNVPNIITNLRVVSINLVENDIVLGFLDLKVGKICEISYMPQLLCGYDVFASVPSECMVTKVLKDAGDGHVIDTGLSAGVLLRHRVKPAFKSAGYIYCQGLADFQRLFGDDGVRAFEKLERVIQEGEYES